MDMKIIRIKKKIKKQNNCLVFENKQCKEKKRQRNVQRKKRKKKQVNRREMKKKIKELLQVMEVERKQKGNSALKNIFRIWKKN